MLMVVRSSHLMVDGSGVCILHTLCGSLNDFVVTALVCIFSRPLVEHEWCCIMYGNWDAW